MHTIVSWVARTFAILGGLVLSALIVLTCLSIVGRAANSMLHGELVQSYMPEFAGVLIGTGVGAINGDFELVEAGMAFAIFAFLPLCQLSGAHASVDVFTARLPLRVNAILRLCIEIVFALTMVLIAVQLFSGMQSKHASGQTTLLLQFPVWWGYALCVPGAVAAALVAVHIAVSRFIEVTTGRTVLPSEAEASH